MADCCKRCCNLKLFGFGGASPDEFLTSQWNPNRSNGETSVWYFVYRVIAMVYFVSSSIAYIVTLSYDQSLFFIYLTHWGVMLIAAFQICDFAMLAVNLAKPKNREEGEINSDMKITWILSTSASSAAFFITPFYWIVLFDPEEDKLDYFNVFVHALNSVIVFIEVWVTARPWRWQHFYQPVVFGAIYVTFSLIYHAADGKDKNGKPYIYTVLDWREPGTAAAWSIGAIFLAVLAHFINVGLCELRRYIAGKCAKEAGNNRVEPLRNSGNSSPPVWRTTSSAFHGGNAQDTMPEYY